MKNKHTRFAEELMRARPNTQQLVLSMLLDVWPGPPTRADFGLATQKHYFYCATLR